MTAITTSTTSANQQIGSSILGTLGVGNGININSLVTQLANAEGQPVLNQISSEESAVSSQLSAFGQLQSALSTFQTAVSSLQTSNSLQADSATSSNTGILTVTPGSNAVTGSHTVEVDQLAAQQSSITTAGFATKNVADSKVAVGTGSLTFTTKSGSSINLTVDSSNNTLQGLANAINNAPGNSFVTASILNVDNVDSSGNVNGTVAKLVLTATNSGTANSFTVSGTDSDGNNTDNAGLSQLFSANLTDQTSAADSIIKVDGQQATNSSNSISNVLQGITLNLQSASKGTSVNVGVTLNNTAISTAVSNFVTAYNSLGSVIQGLDAYGGATNGALFGNSTLENIARQLRTMSTDVVSSATSGYNSLAMIGVTVDQNGVMALDNTKLSAALAADPSSVNNVFNSSKGVAVNLNSAISDMILTGGPLSSATTSLSNQLADLQNQQTAENAYLDSYKATLQQQFSAMQSIVSQYSSTGSFLTSWIASSTGTSSTKG